MIAKSCPVCGEKSLVSRQGEYRMDLPPHFAAAEAVLANMTWWHCGACGEDILSPELEKAINEKYSLKPSPVR